VSSYCIWPISSAPRARKRATTASMSSTANMMQRMPSVFTGASTGPNLIALGEWNLSSSMPCPSGVRIIARVARTSLSPDQSADQRPFDCRLALKLEAQFDEERLGDFEIVDNDEDVVHPLKRHILPLLASLLMPVLAARGAARAY